ncbi:MAG: hypothetical protein PHX60_02770 [Giesbergeria sp.]|uniref:hypothetical protein n=1 Tax=Giesbergeria sp. TaxID=2818473 RepID=UPI002638A32F|nr:hypothetical protein [Giesbergeria sp.]MDD2608602.1 hypothetical protein [Giesbergeria sp.]
MERIEPAVFHHAPQGLDAIEFGAVRGQKVQRHTTLLKQFEFPLDSLGLVTRAKLRPLPLLALLCMAECHCHTLPKSWERTSTTRKQRLEQAHGRLRVLQK